MLVKGPKVLLGVRNNIYFSWFLFPNKSVQRLLYKTRFFIYDACNMCSGGMETNFGCCACYANNKGTVCRRKLCCTTQVVPLDTVRNPTPAFHPKYFYDFNHTNVEKWFERQICFMFLITSFVHRGLIMCDVPIRISDNKGCVKMHLRIDLQSILLLRKHDSFKK